MIYRDELAALEPRAGCASHYTYTREPPPGWTGCGGRVDARDARRRSARRRRTRPRIFVCGPTPFVEHVADLLVDAGHDPGAIHAERFGPTGG